MAKFPLGGLNLDLKTLAGVQAHDAEGPVQRNSQGSEPTMQARHASGGATSGLAANPARNGMVPPRMGPPAMGSGQPPARGGSPAGVAAQPGQHPRTHSLTLASLAHLKSVGHAHPNHHAIAATAKAGIASTKAAGAPKPSGGFGALGGAGGGVAPNPSFGAPGGRSGLPGASPAAMGGPPIMEE